MTEQNTAALAEMPAYEGPKDMIVQDDSEFANLLDTAKFNHLWRVANIFSSSKMVPDHFRGDPASTLVALQMAFRLQVDPLMLLQKTYVLKGKPGIEAQLAIALINTRGPFKGPIQWNLEPNADKPTKCTAWAIHKITGQRCDISLDMDTVKAEGWYGKDGSKWKTIPAQMFRYRTAMWLGRAYCPEVLMGLYSVDELIDGGTGETIDITPEPAEEVPEQPQGPILEDFLAKCGERDPELIKKFLDETAKTHGMEREAVMALAISTDEQLAGFLDTFDQWLQPPGQAEEKPVSNKKGSSSTKKAGSSKSTKPKAAPEQQQPNPLASADQLNALAELIADKGAAEEYGLTPFEVLGALHEHDGGDLKEKLANKVMAELKSSPPSFNTIDKAIKAKAAK